MTDPESSYRPRSPDFSSFQPFLNSSSPSSTSLHPKANSHNNNNNNLHSAYQPPVTSYIPPNPLGQHASYDTSPFFAAGYQPTVVNSHYLHQQQQSPPHQYYRQSFPYNSTFGNNPYDASASSSSLDDEMARRSARISAQQAQAEAQSQAQAKAQIQTQAQLPPDHASMQYQHQHQLQHQHQQPASLQTRPSLAPEGKFVFDDHIPAVAPSKPESDERQPKPWDGIDVKTKFPVARIKRIMQADEEVGKVAQVTPIAVSKALELFMISLVTKAAQEARDRNSKRVTAAHLKQAVAKDEVLDFLADICAKVPDHSARKNDEDGSDNNANEGKRRSGAGRRKKDIDSDDF